MKNYREPSRPFVWLFVCVVAFLACAFRSYAENSIQIDLIIQPSLDVFVDGEYVGITNAEGRLVFALYGAGYRLVTVTAKGVKYVLHEQKRHVYPAISHYTWDFSGHVERITATRHPSEAEALVNESSLSVARRKARAIIADAENGDCRQAMDGIEHFRVDQAAYTLNTEVTAIFVDVMLECGRRLQDITFSERSADLMLEGGFSSLCAPHRYTQFAEVMAALNAPGRASEKFAEVVKSCPKNRVALMEWEILFLLEAERFTKARKVAEAAPLEQRSLFFAWIGGRSGSCEDRSLLDESDALECTAVPPSTCYQLKGQFYHRCATEPRHYKSAATAFDLSMSDEKSVSLESLLRFLPPWAESHYRIQNFAKAAGLFEKLRNVRPLGPLESHMYASALFSSPTPDPETLLKVHKGYEDALKKAGGKCDISKAILFNNVAVLDPVLSKEEVEMSRLDHAEDLLYAARKCTPAKNKDFRTLVNLNLQQLLKLRLKNLSRLPVERQYKTVQKVVRKGELFSSFEVAHTLTVAQLAGDDALFAVALLRDQEEN